MNHPELKQEKFIVSPPALYITAFLSGCAIHLIMPVAIFPGSQLAVILGAVLFLASAALARWSFLTLQQYGTSGKPGQPSAALATSGPFRFSRNPVYVAMTGLYLGLNFMLDSVWPILMLVPLLLVMNRGVISREERYLAEQFGKTYTDYCLRVRRWL